MHGQKDRQHPKASRMRRKPYHEGARSLCGETLGWALDVYTRERLSRPLRHSAIRLRDCPLGSGSRVNFLERGRCCFGHVDLVLAAECRVFTHSSSGQPIKAAAMVFKEICLSICLYCEKYVLHTAFNMAWQLH